MKVNDGSGGHVSLAKADVAMNAIYEKVSRLQNVSQLSSHECQLPLPKYQENGIFNSYIGLANNFSQSNNHQKQQDSQQPSIILESIVSFDKSKNFDLIDDGMMVPGEQQHGTIATTQEIQENNDDDANQDDYADENNAQMAAASTPMKNNQRMEKLGKVHLTKQMVREREIFLGVKSKLNRAS